MVMHLVAIMMQAGNCIQVFYKIPKKFGCFEKIGNKTADIKTPDKTQDVEKTISPSIQDGEEDASIDSK